MSAHPLKRGDFCRVEGVLYQWGGLTLDSGELVLEWPYGSGARTAAPEQVEALIPYDRDRQAQALEYYKNEIDHVEG